jgi:small conductance mechanosensitive channel
MGSRIHDRSPLRTLLLTLILVISMSTPIYSQQEAAQPIESSLENLETLIQTLETPEKREALLKDLKTLMESQKRQARPKAPQREEPSLGERIIMGYGSVTRETSRFFHRLYDLIRRTPETLRQARAYLSAEKNRAVLYRTALIIGAGMALAILLIVLARRFTSALSRGVLRETDQTIRRKVSEATIRMVICISPYVALFVGSFLVLHLLGIRGPVYQFVILVLSALLVYGAIFGLTSILLSPDARKTRIIPMADETSAYVWIWAKRFLNLGILYYFVTESLEIFSAPPSVLEAIRRILVLLFPIFSTILLLQIKRLYPPSRIRRPVVTFWSRLLGYLMRFWPLAAGVVVWIVSIFIVANYHEGVVFVVFAALKTVIALGILWGLLHLVDPLFNKLFSLGQEIKQRFPGLEEKANRYIGTLRRIAKGVVIGVAIGSILEFWGLRVSWFVTSELGSTILSRLIAVAIVVGAVMAIIDLSDFITQQLVQPRTDPAGQPIEPGRTKRTLVPLIHWAVNVASIFVGGVIVLSQLGVNITPILAGAGIVGLAVGFGAQSLVKDVINGLFLLFEDSVAVGDVVIINGTGGLVEAVTLRTIKMRDLAGNVHVIPNGSVDMVTNMTKGYSRYVFDVGVAYREDVDEVMAILKEIGESLQNDPEYKDDILEPLEILGVDKFDDSAVVIKARFTTKPIKQWRIGREFNRRMKRIFDERNIEIPFPHRTVYWGEAKTGQPQPVIVQLGGPVTGTEEKTT